MKKTGDKYAIQPRDADTTWLDGEIFENLLSGIGIAVIEHANTI